MGSRTRRRRSAQKKRNDTDPSNAEMPKKFRIMKRRDQVVSNPAKTYDFKIPTTRKCFKPRTQQRTEPSPPSSPIVPPKKLKIAVELEDGELMSSDDEDKSQKKALPAPVATKSTVETKKLEDKKIIVEEPQKTLEAALEDVSSDSEDMPTPRSSPKHENVEKSRSPSLSKKSLNDITAREEENQLGRANGNEHEVKDGSAAAPGAVQLAGSDGHEKHQSAESGETAWFELSETSSSDDEEDSEEMKEGKKEEKEREKKDENEEKNKENKKMEENAEKLAGIGSDSEATCADDEEEGEDRVQMSTKKCVRRSAAKRAYSPGTRCSKSPKSSKVSESSSETSNTFNFSNTSNTSSFSNSSNSTNTSKTSNSSSCSGSSSSATSSDSSESSGSEDDEPEAGNNKKQCKKGVPTWKKLSSGNGRKADSSVGVKPATNEEMRKASNPLNGSSSEKVQPKNQDIKKECDEKKIKNEEEMMEDKPPFDNKQDMRKTLAEEMYLSDTDKSVFSEIDEAPNAGLKKETPNVVNQETERNDELPKIVPVRPAVKPSLSKPAKTPLKDLWRPITESNGENRERETRNGAIEGNAGRTEQTEGVLPDSTAKPRDLVESSQPAAQDLMEDPSRPKMTPFDQDLRNRAETFLRMALNDKYLVDFKDHLKVVFIRIIEERFETKEGFEKVMEHIINRNKNAAKPNSSAREKANYLEFYYFFHWQVPELDYSEEEKQMCRNRMNRNQQKIIELTNIEHRNNSYSFDIELTNLLLNDNM